MASTCLIAEADPFIADLLLRFAEESGLLSVRARTGQEILTLAQPIPPDILIVEPELPGELRGWEAVRMIRSGGANGAMAVIGCSWLGEGRDVRVDRRRRLALSEAGPALRRFCQGVGGRRC